MTLLCRDCGAVLPARIPRHRPRLHCDACIAHRKRESSAAFKAQAKEARLAAAPATMLHLVKPVCLEGEQHYWLLTETNYGHCLKCQRGWQFPTIAEFYETAGKPNKPISLVKAGPREPYPVRGKG